MEAYNLEGASVLDVGCGTGILAIAAEKLGAASCLGFDIDPDCRENMDRHLAMNRTQNVKLEIGTLADIKAEANYDLVLANITINILEQTWPHLKAYMKPGAVLISSGILLEQQRQALALLKANGFTVRSISQLGEWCAIEAVLS
jgi:ribosomal protein L11 methyltransferase